eukprot:2856714-Amphidinium_carterae.1
MGASAMVLSIPKGAPCSSYDNTCGSGSIAQLHHAVKSSTSTGEAAPKRGWGGGAMFALNPKDK